MFWLAMGIGLVALGSINQHSGRIAAANEDLLFIARFGREAYERRQKMYLRCRRIVNGAFIFFGVLAITCLTSCAPSYPVAWVYDKNDPRLNPNDPCAGQPQKAWEVCHYRLVQNKENARQQREHAEDVKEYRETVAKHICNSITPDGCLTDAQKQANMVVARRAQDAASCNYGDMAACQRYPGGMAAANNAYYQMKMRDCLSTFSFVDRSDRYYGSTAHLPCY